jgi:hypothetical protein
LHRERKGKERVCFFNVSRPSALFRPRSKSNRDRVKEVDVEVGSDRRHEVCTSRIESLILVGDRIIMCSVVEEGSWLNGRWQAPTRVRCRIDPEVARSGPHELIRYLFELFDIYTMMRMAVVWLSTMAVCYG